MFIDRLHVRNLKLLSDFALDFTRSDGSPRLWTVLIGPNGTAKTSILQAIALAAAGSLQANTLAEPVVGHLLDRRRSGLEMEVQVDFRFSARGSDTRLHPRLGRSLGADERLRSTVILKQKQSTVLGTSSYYGPGGPLSLETNSELSPLDDARANNRPFWFVAGYGVGRFLPEPQRRPSLVRPAIERLEPLFRNTTGLISFGFLDQLNDQKKARRFAEVLRNTLTGVDELVPAIQGIELGGRGGVLKSGSLIEKERIQLKIGPDSYKLPAVALSHGYQSTIAWIADLIGHVMWEATEPIEAVDIEGLVLIDEIDLYLHPQWQAKLIPALRRTFPKLQFVVTTHSPVVLSSLHPDEIVVLGQNPQTGDVERYVPDGETGDFAPRSQVQEPGRPPDPRAMSGTDVYRTWFGLDRLTLNPHGQLLRQYLLLANDPNRSDDDETQLRDLQDKLDRAGLDPNNHRPS